LATQQEWTEVLELAKKWSFDSVQSRAIRELHSRTSPFEQLVLARKFEILDWVEPAILQLCARDEALQAKEIRRLESADVALICYVRERVRKLEYSPDSHKLREAIKEAHDAWNEKTTVGNSAGQSQAHGKNTKINQEKSEEKAEDKKGKSKKGNTQEK
jgi:hypothetical protein